MKQIIVLILSAVCLLGVATNSSYVKQSADTPVSKAQDTSTKENEKKAVVYFSATGNTKAVAELIAKETNADIYEIIPTQEYTNEDLNYNNTHCRANLEMNDESARPAIKNDLSVLNQYDVIYLGYPIWWGTCPRIIQTFFENYDLSRAKIYTFCTSGSSGIEKSISDLKALYPNINIIDGKRLNPSSEATIKNWLKTIN